MVTDHASLTWLCNFKEPEGVVARWITQLQPFDFKIVHRPGTHHSHADGLSRRTSRPCKRDTCPECAPLLHKVTPEGEETVRAVTLQEQYMEHFDGYIEPIEDDCALFRTLTEQVPSTPPVAPELMWYMGPHPKSEGEPVSARDLELSPKQAVPAVSRAKVIERLLDVDSRQACTQTEPEDFPKSQQDSDAEEVSLLAEPIESLPFPDGMAEPDHMVRATGKSRPASPALQALIDLSNVELAREQEQDPNLRLIMDMIRDSLERPSWEHVHAESAEVKALWSQYGSLKIRDGALLRRRKNQGCLKNGKLLPHSQFGLIFFKLATTTNLQHTKAWSVLWL